MATRIKEMLRIQPAIENPVQINDTLGPRNMAVINKIWYIGEAEWLAQLYKNNGVQGYAGKERFWAAAPGGVRKLHTGLPALIVDTLTHMVLSDLNDLDWPDEEKEGKERWEKIGESLDLSEILGEALQAALSEGDAVAKVSIDPDLSAHPMVEIYPADQVEYITKRGKTTGVIFYTNYPQEDGREYRLKETYAPGQVTYELYRDDQIVDLSAIPQTTGLDNDGAQIGGGLMLALPLKIYKSPKYPDRGQAIYAKKLDAMDALDEVVSQWIDAVRRGRVQRYIPESMMPRNPNTGEAKNPTPFGSDYISTKSQMKEGVLDKVEVIQPEIRYEAYLSTYTSTLDMCLQGILSPATLGIDLGKMASGEAQREKKDITGSTRNAITSVLEKWVPQLVELILQADDLMHERQPGEYHPMCSFGEYGAPDFGSRVEVVSKAAASGIMSIEAQVDETWGSSKDDEWKKEEVARIKAEKGIETMAEPSPGNTLVEV